MKALQESEYVQALANGSVERRKLGDRARSKPDSPKPDSHLDAFRKLTAAVERMTACVKELGAAQDSSVEAGLAQILKALGKVAREISELGATKPKKRRWKHTVTRNKDQRIESIESVQE